MKTQTTSDRLDELKYFLKGYIVALFDLTPDDPTLRTLLEELATALGAAAAYLRVGMEGHALSTLKRIRPRVTAYFQGERERLERHANLHLFRYEIDRLIPEE
jgi:hypothetical protein